MGMAVVKVVSGTSGSVITRLRWLYLGIRRVRLPVGSRTGIFGGNRVLLRSEYSVPPWVYGCLWVSMDVERRVLVLLSVTFHLWTRLGLAWFSVCWFVVLT